MLRKTPRSRHIRQLISPRRIGKKSDISPRRSAEPLKDWSNSIRRQLQSDATGTVAAPIISTTAEVLKTIFGEDNVTEASASSSHGALTSIEVKEGVMSEEEAFLFLMKDGDDTFMLGTTSGFPSLPDPRSPGTPRSARTPGRS